MGLEPADLLLAEAAARRRTLLPRARPARRAGLDRLLRRRRRLRFLAPRLVLVPAEADRRTEGREAVPQAHAPQLARPLEPNEERDQREDAGVRLALAHQE